MDFGEYASMGVCDVSVNVLGYCVNKCTRVPWMDFEEHVLMGVYTTPGEPGANNRPPLYIYIYQ